VLLRGYRSTHRDGIEIVEPLAYSMVSLGLQVRLIVLHSERDSHIEEQTVCVAPRAGSDVMTVKLSEELGMPIPKCCRVKRGECRFGDSPNGRLLG